MDSASKPYSQSSTPASLSPEPDIERASPPGLAFEKEAEENFKPKTLKFWLIILSSFLSMFLVALDRTIISTAIPKITDDFKSLGDIGWYGSAYMLTTAAFQLVFGRIYRFYNLRWTFLWCIVLFEAGSVICGAAPTSAVFIFGRAVAGIGSAGIMTGTTMVVIPMVPLHKRPMFQCMYSLCRLTCTCTDIIRSTIRPRVWAGLGRRSSYRRSLHGARNVEMVLLHESASWCSSFCVPVPLLEVAREAAEACFSQRTHHEARPSRHLLLHSFSRMPCPRPSMGWL